MLENIDSRAVAKKLYLCYLIFIDAKLLLQFFDDLVQKVLKFLDLRLNVALKFTSKQDSLKVDIVSERFDQDVRLCIG